MRILLLTVLFPVALAAQDPFIEKLMRSRPEHFRKVMDHARKLEVQIIYTRIDRDTQNRPQFTTYTYRADSNRYFYPASTVKFPMVLLALEKMKELGLPDAR